MKLNKSNYHTLSNRYLTNSRIGDYLNDRRYFYELHIAGTRQKEKGLALILGSAVDCWLTEGKKVFDKTYYMSPKATDDPYRLTQKQWDDVAAMCNMMEEQPAYKALKNFKRQQIFQYDMPIGEHFCGLAAMVDFIKIEGNKAIICDLKTSSCGEEKKYFYHCLEYRYFAQAAHFQYVISKCHPEITEFEFRHLVIEKNPDVFKPYVYILSQDRIEMQMAQLEKEIIPMIANDTKFESHKVSWEQAQEIGSLLDY